MNNKYWLRSPGCQGDGRVRARAKCTPNRSWTATTIRDMCGSQTLRDFVTDALRDRLARRTAPSALARPDWMRCFASSPSHLRLDVLRSDVQDQRQPDSDPIEDFVADCAKPFTNQSIRKALDLV